MSVFIPLLPQYSVTHMNVESLVQLQPDKWKKGIWHVDLIISDKRLLLENNNQNATETGNKSVLSHDPVSIITCHIQYSKDSWKLPSTIQRRTHQLVYTCTVSFNLLNNCSSLSNTLDIYLYKKTKQTKKIFVHVFPTSLPVLGDYCPREWPFLHLSHDWSLNKTSSNFVATSGLTNHCLWQSPINSC